MKISRAIYIIAFGALFLYLVACNKKMVTVFDSRTAEHLDYIITTQKVKFHFNDSVYLFTAFVRPNGEFYLRKNFQDSIDKYCRQWGINSKVYTEKYVLNNDSLLELYSYFPLLIKHDSSVINHYEHPEDFEIKFIYEPLYSYLLHLTNEPILSSEKNVQEIRITSPDEDIDLLSKPKTRFTVRLKMLSENSQLFLTEGAFDSNGNFTITRKDSCFVEDKDILKITKAINKIDFKEEYYFAELGLDNWDKFLFEYKNASEYYVIERGVYNGYNHKRNVQRVYHLLLIMKNKYFISAGASL